MHSVEYPETGRTEGNKLPSPTAWVGTSRQFERNRRARIFYARVD
jgi:hypothetical protein